MTLPLIIDSSALREALAGSQPPKVLDLRPAEVFASSHISGARHIDSRLLNRPAPPFVGLLPDTTGVQALIEAADLRADDTIVAVDTGRSTEAARLIWVLHAWGFTATSWLNGGMSAWAADGGSLTSETEQPSQDLAAHPHFEAVAQAAPKATADELLAALDDPSLRVLDVRGAAEFAGTDLRSAEGGHVPGAKHLEWTNMLDPDGRLLDVESLRAKLAALDIQPEHRVVTYCQSHQRSSVAWLILKSLGYDNVQGLDGAWSVWGNRAELPKEL